MKKTVSCCGVVCSQCEHFPHVCLGCSQIEGKVFWLKYTNEAVCNIYHCCVKEKAFLHCGQCKELPCRFYTDAYDPTKSKDENEMILKKQLQELSLLGKAFFD